MLIDAPCFHSSDRATPDPEYWLDWALDDLSHGVLALEPALEPCTLARIGREYRERLCASQGFDRLVGLGLPACDLECFLLVCAQIFPASHYPELAVPVPRRRTRGAWEEAAEDARVLRRAAELARHEAPAASGQLLALAAQRVYCGGPEDAAESAAASLAEALVLALGVLLSDQPETVSREEIAADLLCLLLDEPVAPESITLLLSA